MFFRTLNVYKGNVTGHFSVCLGENDQQTGFCLKVKVFLAPFKNLDERRSILDK